MDCELGAAQARALGVTGGTVSKYASSWNLWLDFLHRIHFHNDPYLEELSPPDKLRVCSAFLHARRRGDLGGTRSARQVAASTAKSTLDHVASTFVANSRPDPTADTRGDRHEYLRRQISGYRRHDPPVKHQKALPPIVFRHVIHYATHPRAKARSQLLSGALFFALRSCEYLFIGHKDRKTRTIEVQDIVFTNGASIVPHSSPHLHLSEAVTINFGDQKSEIRFELVTQYNNGDSQLNPVYNWASIVRRIRSYPGFSPSWPVFTYHDEKGFSRITASEITIEIKAAVSAIGEDVLGFTPDDVGAHSPRASLAMLMYLAKEPVYTIMLIGRWSSDAFLAYIEKQIKEFTKGVSTRMLQHETFINIPAFNHHMKENQGTQSRQARQRDIHKAVFGHQGSLRHALRPRN